MGVIYLRILITPIRCLILHHAFGSCANAYNHFTKGCLLYTSDAADE